MRFVHKAGYIEVEKIVGVIPISTVQGYNLYALVRRHVGNLLRYHYAYLYCSDLDVLATKALALVGVIDSYDKVTIVHESKSDVEILNTQIQQILNVNNTQQEVSATPII